MITTEITPGIGLGALVFGLTRERVQTLIGEPNSKETIAYDNDDNDQTEVWHFDDHDLSLGFDQDEDWRLVTLSITGDQYTLNEKPIIGQVQLKVVDLLTEVSGETLDVEDCSSAEAPACFRLGSEALSMNVWCEESEATEIIATPSFTDEDEIVWPEAGA